MFSSVLYVCVFYDPEICKILQIFTTVWAHVWNLFLGVICIFISICETRWFSSVKTHMRNGPFGVKPDWLLWSLAGVFLPCLWRLRVFCAHHSCVEMRENNSQGKVIQQNICTRWAHPQGSAVHWKWIGSHQWLVRMRTSYMYACSADVRTSFRVDRRGWFRIRMKSGWQHDKLRSQCKGRALATILRRVSSGRCGPQTLVQLEIDTTLCQAKSNLSYFSRLLRIMCGSPVHTDIVAL